MTTAENRNTILVICLALLTFIAVAAALKFAQGLFAPITLGLVIGVVLAPLAKRLENLGASRVVCAAAALALAATITVFILTVFGPILTSLLDQRPRIEAELRSWFGYLTQSIRGLDELAMEVSDTAEKGQGDDAVEDAMPGLADALWMAPNFIAQLLIFSGTLFFFILTREDLYANFPKHQAALRSADRSVSFYFTTITMINFGLGFALFIALTAIGMPNAVLWGAAAFLLNFVLYLGPITLMIALLVSGLITFNGAYSFLPALSFLLLNMTEAQFVTPSLVGARLRVSPLGVFLAIVFGLWLWGPIGGIIAIPILVWTYAIFKARQETATV